MATYRLSLLYDHETPEVSSPRGTCLTDDWCRIGSVFYAQWGRAIVQACVRTDDPARELETKLRTKVTLRGMWVRVLSSCVHVGLHYPTPARLALLYERLEEAGYAPVKANREGTVFAVAHVIVIPEHAPELD